MTTARQIDANRKNARASQGPKTAPGKARAAANARRHGWSTSIWSDPCTAAAAETLAQAIAGSDPSPQILAAARRVAEAQIEIMRLRTAQKQIPEIEPKPENIHDKLDWYVNHELSPEMISVVMSALPVGTLHTILKMPLRLEDLCLEFLTSMQQRDARERYERRAMSRRWRAIQDLDTLRILEEVTGEKNAQPPSSAPSVDPNFS